MASLPPEIRRVLLALSGVAEEWAALDAAIDLADRLQAELAALFIEDDDLLRASMLPCVREIGRSSAQSRRLQFDQLQRALRAAATEAEQRLRRHAETRALRFSFQVLRGRPVPQLLGMAGQLDLVLLPSPAWGRRRQPAHRPVAVFYDATAATEPALAMAAALARSAGAPLHVLIAANDEAALRRAAAQARSHAPDLKLTVERAGDLAEQANRRAAGALVLQAAGGFDAALIDRLRNRLHCDLLVLR